PVPRLSRTQRKRKYGYGNRLRQSVHALRAIRAHAACFLAHTPIDPAACVLFSPPRQPRPNWHFPIARRRQLSSPSRATIAGDLSIYFLLLHAISKTQVLPVER